MAGWVELALLRRSLNRKIGATGLPASYTAKLWSAACAGAAAAWAVKLAVGTSHPLLLAALALAPFGLVYFGAAYAMKLPEADQTMGRALRLVGRFAGRRAR